MPNPPELGQLAVIWDDEEPLYLRTPILQFQKRYGWEVTACQTPHSVLQKIERMSDDDLARSVLILDLMMPVLDRDEEFTREATENGMLTGLEVARKLRASQKIGKFKAVFFYSVLSYEDLLEKVQAFIGEVRAADIQQRIEFVSKGDVTFGELPGYIHDRVEELA